MQKSTVPGEEGEIFVIDGQMFSDIPGFYAELNRIFMADEEWQLGQSLDALDDLLYAGYGALQGVRPVSIMWRAMDKSAADLGIAATHAWLTEKLRHPTRFNHEMIHSQIDALERGDGKTYFDLVIEVFQDHPEIRLISS